MAAGLETFSTEHALNCYLRSIVHNGDIIHGRGHASGVVSQVHNVAALINDCGRNGLFPGGLATPASLRFKICIIERRCLLRKKPSLPATGVAGSGRDRAVISSSTNAISPSRWGNKVLPAKRRYRGYRKRTELVGWNIEEKYRDTQQPQRLFFEHCSGDSEPANRINRNRSYFSWNRI